MGDDTFEKGQTRDILLSLHLRGKIVKEIAGTFGTVFIVEQEAGVYPRHMAYKTLKTTEQRPGPELKNFVREARQWFKVRGHPLVLTPLYITTFAELPLICMPFCETDLQGYLENRCTLDLTETLVFAAQILKGLIIANRNGIEAHQDLKPSNVLLEDLSKKFVYFPPDNVHPSVKFKLIVADFGMANAWKELGKPQGSLPYMAPEQYAPQEYERFCPDIFAVGVMLCEMLTGRHPCGKTTKRAWRDWNRNKWEQWAKAGKRDIDTRHDEESGEMKTLITKMLLPDPNERPSMDDAFNKIMGLLSLVSQPTSAQLRALLDYYDALAGYLEPQRRLRSLAQLSTLPEQLDIVIEELLYEISITEGELNGPESAVYFCELCSMVCALLLKRKRDSDTEKARLLAERIVDEADKWRAQIRTRHKYPELRFRGDILIETPPVRDFEVYADIIGHARTLLENIVGAHATEDVFDNRDVYTQSAYLFSIASDLHQKGDERKAIEVLDRCIGLYPAEAVFYYMKALWTKGYLLFEEMKTSTEETIALKKVVFENAEQALRIDPALKGPQRLL